MKFILTVIASFCLLTYSFAQQAADPTQDPATASNAFFKAMLDEDGNTLGKLLTSDCVLISFDGSSVDGSQLIQGVGGGYVVVETGAVSNASTRQYNNDAAVVTGSWKTKGAVQGNGFDATVMFSVVCVKQGSGWKISNIQFTPTR
ncbi:MULTISPECIES: nuclear transport factor 2 family protein [unclassified Spirosoma]|uniref:nuclear transport factor 2 family protein n=1 Tax=unclassified Spirosoma TaxID=2621999 RepID=UPI00095DE6DB|nr:MULTISPECIES: nuclear transport factor 2 family protein [unclassified Spirosoma]MBN8823045.1 nuclear transport factor 2 family protein [Spirosoma sp.]OJW73145.1 MAG: DUF4440 domain-containing protein [Spirosoma sp. 48-14]